MVVLVERGWVAALSAVRGGDPGRDGVDLKGSGGVGERENAWQRLPEGWREGENAVQDPLAEGPLQPWKRAAVMRPSQATFQSLPCSLSSTGVSSCQRRGSSVARLDAIAEDRELRYELLPTWAAAPDVWCFMSWWASTVLRKQLPR